MTTAVQGTKPRKVREPRLKQRVSLAVTGHQLRAMRWKARERGLWDARRRLLIGVVLRDQSLAEIVREYEEALITPV